MAEKIDIAGLYVSSITKTQFLEELTARIKESHKTFVITPYSEFLYESFQKPSLLPILNSANFSVADGIGMLWASTFLNIPFKSQSYYGRICEAAWQTFYTLLAVIFRPEYLKKFLPEKIVGANLIWDLADLANKNGWSMYLLGGFGNTAELAVSKLKTKYPKLNVVGHSNKDPEDLTIIDDINNTKPDILCVAFGPIRQERWIYENLPALQIKMAIGLGGTFDYLAGKYKVPPSFVRNLGLEWLWRLITQPWRWKRIYNATVGLVSGVMRYKIFNSFPLRSNAVIVIVNQRGEVLVCERNPDNFYTDILEDPKTLMQRGYWQLPQGGIDVQEDLIKAALREAEEEVGLQNLELIKISNRTNEYEWNNARRRLFRNVRYVNKGQKQQIVFFRFLGQDAEIKIDNREFINHKWVNAAELSNITHPERAGLTEIVMEELA